MNPEVRKAVKLLMNVWDQYGQSRRDQDGLHFEHRNMSAGEEAAEYLESLGLGYDQGYVFVVNEEGEKLMNEED